MNAGYVLDAVTAGLIVPVLLWFARRVGTTITQEQRKRCGPFVIGFYLFMSAYFLIGLGLVSFGTYCIFGAIPIPWVLRAIYGAFVTGLGATGMFQASSVLRRDPSPVDWKDYLRQLKAGLRHHLGFDMRTTGRS